MCKAVTAQTGNNPHAHSQYKRSMNCGTFTHHIVIGKNKCCHIQQGGGPSQTERWVKPARVKRGCTVGRHYMKFRNKQNEPVLLEIRPLAALGNGTDWEGCEGAFWGVKDLHLNWSGGYTWVSICKSLLSFIRYICVYCQSKHKQKNPSGFRWLQIEVYGCFLGKGDFPELSPCAVSIWGWEYLISYLNPQYLNMWCAHWRPWLNM